MEKHIILKVFADHIELIGCQDGKMTLVLSAGDNSVCFDPSGERPSDSRIVFEIANEISTDNDVRAILESRGYGNDPVDFTLIAGECYYPI